MSIRYLKPGSIDKGKWDDCIRHASPALIYAYSWYLDAVCRSWGALVQGDYEAVMPLPYRNVLGMKLGLQPLFCQQLGVFSRTDSSVERIQGFLNAVPAHFLVVNYHLNHRSLNGSSQVMRTNLVLDLIPEYETLKKNFDQSLIRGLRKSEKTSCSLLEGLDVRSMLDLYRYQNQEKGFGLKPASFEWLETLIYACIQKGTLLSVGLYSPVNQLCSFGIFLRDRDRVYYLLGASDQEGRDYFGMGRIFDHVIRKYAGKAYTFDFEGSEIPGVARFFKNFGAVNQPYPLFRRNRLGIFGERWQ